MMDDYYLAIARVRIGRNTWVLALYKDEKGYYIRAGESGADRKGRIRPFPNTDSVEEGTKWWHGVLDLYLAQKAKESNLVTSNGNSTRFGFTINSEFGH